VAKNRHLRTIAQLYRAVPSQLRHVSTIGKSLLSSIISSTCVHHMVNFGPLLAEIGPVVWDTPANFNSFRVLAALLHGTAVLDVSQTLRREQRAPPIFVRAAITLGIGPQSITRFEYSFCSPLSNVLINELFLLLLITMFLFVNFLTAV